MRRTMNHLTTNEECNNDCDERQIMWRRMTEGVAYNNAINIFIILIIITIIIIIIISKYV